MALRHDLEQHLSRLSQSSTTMPTTVQIADSNGIELRLELVRLESMSCAFSELVLFVPQLSNVAFDVLKRWADALSQRVRYLMEKIGMLEVDPTHGQVLIRSLPPHSTPAGQQYYEVLLSQSGNGTFALRRYRSIAGQPGRDLVEITVTHEVLFKLVEDLIETIPTGP
ncbi:hypothetical protein [Planctomicrobium sp. SH527]|uniref:hypothetical protein n=1 Tax=Planctomicrobium sp. SH527 TaxID=3448123 RepID=UPI003F5BB75B